MAGGTKALRPVAESAGTHPFHTTRPGDTQATSFSLQKMLEKPQNFPIQIRMITASNSPGAQAQGSSRGHNPFLHTITRAHRVYDFPVDAAMTGLQQPWERSTFTVGKCSGDNALPWGNRRDTEQRLNPLLVHQVTTDSTADSCGNETANESIRGHVASR